MPYEQVDFAACCSHRLMSIGELADALSAPEDELRERFGDTVHYWSDGSTVRIGCCHDQVRHPERGHSLDCAIGQALSRVKVSADLAHYFPSKNAPDVRRFRRWLRAGYDADRKRVDRRMLDALINQTRRPA